MKSRWVHHNSKRIFVADFSNLGNDASAVQAETEAIKTTLKLEAAHSVRSVTIVLGTFNDPEIIKALAALLPYSNKYVCIRALVGLSGFRKYFVEAFTNLVGNVPFKQFDTLDLALDWISLD